MWRIVQSQRVEKLFEAFLHDLERPGDDLVDPMTPEVVVVQDMGMARWLTHQLALRRGVAANLQFLVPAALVNLAYSAWLGEGPSAQNSKERVSADRTVFSERPDPIGSDLSIEGPRPAGPSTGVEGEDPWGRLELTWRLFRLLHTHRQDPRLQELQRYMGDDVTGQKRYQLAAQIAAAFDRYMMYRQDVLRSWEAGNGSDWQAHLWRWLVEESPSLHMAQKHALFMKAVRNGCAPRFTGKLPSRVHLFGVTMIAPVHMEVFDALASWIDVALYFLNPSREYWGDLSIGTNQDVTPQPLMASWAQAGCFLLNRIQELGGHHEDLFEDFQPSSLLEAVQHDIFTLTDRRTHDPKERALFSSTASIQVHACHSPMREIQVLHDHLAHLLETLPHLTPEDVVVMAPNIDIYAPYVEAVFGTRDHPRLPWNLSDRKSVEEDPVLQKILDLLHLPQWRCTASDILSLMQVPAIAARYGLDEEGLERVRTWIREAGIRWGLDAGMRKELELPGNDEHTWRFGLDRLLAGYALPPREIFCAGVLSYPDVEASEAHWLGALHDLVNMVARWRKTLRVPKTPEEWRACGNALVDDFFHPDAEASLRRFRRALDTFATAARNAGCTQPLSVHVVRNHLEDILAQSPNVRRFLSGGITFCNLAPMRAIPFRVVCLLGMNDADFPRSDRLPPFDLTAQNPRPGDRRRGPEDRYLFLEALMSARNVFYVSYIGRDIRDNSLKVPSVVVSELLDYLEQSYRTSNESIRDAIVLEHPLPPFSPRLFNSVHERLFSYDPLWLQAVQAVEQPSVPPFVDQDLPLNAPDVAEVALEDLLRFFEDPCAWFLEKRLGMVLSSEEDALEDEEPFELNALERYWLADEILGGLLKDEDPREIQRRVHGRGWLPHGVAGNLLFEVTCLLVQDMASKVANYRGTLRPPVEVDVPAGGVRIRGWLRDVTEKGRLVYRPAKIKAKDRLRLWIRHLALCAVHPSGILLESVHIGTGKDGVFRLTPVDDPHKHLADLVELWRVGHQRPLPFFPESSWAYAEKSGKASATASPAQICGKAWKDEYKKQGDAYRPSVRTAFRGVDPLNDTFVDVALRVFGPILKMIEASKA
ncbi:exodeoxyribonuclease V subunit gamma [Desulfosoma caldarium]|uniref:DNA helicase/exodeoxyribonuclease V gamma subunit n=1 Tax=Desulfosoma caldarium TaxID=610254 RepID=A0A3N1VG03_9BACT|nr:exodeoxyribonuclease V subunit gamma [Desulfosoma caldarium]ROR01776.1 DNA helicase/exodeoxyribonuclease V gamma subunit [Desulfosoma caldarium]